MTEREASLVVEEEELEMGIRAAEQRVCAPADLRAHTLILNWSR